MAEIELGQADSGGTRRAAEGDEVVVALDETPTSGYRWEVEAVDPAVLALADDSFEPPEPGLMGGGGTRRFRFRVTGPGSGAIRLIRRRPWDPDSIADSFEATVNASGGTAPAPAAEDPDAMDAPTD